MIERRKDRKINMRKDKNTNRQGVVITNVRSVVSTREILGDHFYQLRTTWTPHDYHMATTMILTIVMICCLPSHLIECVEIVENCKKRRSKKTKINKKEEEKNPWCCRRKISYWPCSFHSVCDNQQRNLWTHTCTTWENKFLKISIYLTFLPTAY